MQQSSGTYSDQVERPEGLYVGDEWQATPRLTFDGSLRWEPFIPEREIYGRFEQFIASAFTAGVHSSVVPTAPAGIFFLGDCYQGYCIPDSGEKGDMKNFAPRLGFAYDVFGNGKTVIRGGGGVFYETRLSTFFLNDPSIAPPFSLSINLSNGPVGNLSTPDSNEPVFVQNFPQRYTIATVPKNLAFPNGVRVWTLEPNHPWQTPATYDWNLTLEQQINQGTLLRLSYVGTRATHLREDNELNASQYSLWQSLGCTSYSGACGTDARRPYQGLTNVYLSTNDGNISYNAFHATVLKRPFASISFAHNLTLSGSYTWSKSMDDPLANGGGITDIGSAGDGGTSGLPYGDPMTKAWDTGPSDYDHTNALVLSYVWGLPQFAGENHFVRAAIGGWNWGGIWSARSGDALTVMAPSGQDASKTGLGLERAVFTGTASEYGYAGANATSCINPSNGKPRANALACDPYLNTSLFQSPTVGSFGNVGKDSFRGPAFWNYDMDLIKTFTPTSSHENLRLQIRGDFYNFFNHVNPGDPNTTMNSSSFGLITGAAYGPRIIQLAAKVFF